MNAHAFPMCLTTCACPLVIMLVRSVSATLHPHVSNCFQMVTDFICLSGGIHISSALLGYPTEDVACLLFRAEFGGSHTTLIFTSAALKGSFSET